MLMRGSIPRNTSGPCGAAPYSVEREIEDLAALVRGAGGPVFLFALGQPPRRQREEAVLYKPPFIVYNSHPPGPGLVHGTVLMAPQVLAAEIKEYFGSRNDC